MRRLTVRAWAVALAAVLLPAPVAAQQTAAKTNTGGATKPAPLSAVPLRRPVIAPAKPMVAVKSTPAAPAGDSGATPTALPNPKAARLSVSARQAAEQTIAALVAAMKNMPKRPPAPPEPRTAAARRAATVPRAAAVEAPTPINYHVTWPAKPEEPGLDTRVELAWPGGNSGPVALRWNEPSQPVP